jgi:siderophore synthetase component
MITQPLTGTQPLDAVTWQKVNNRLLAKSLAELMHEQVAVPAIASADNDGRTRFRLSTDNPTIHYTFSGYRRQLDYWHIEAHSIQRHDNGLISPATDAPLFFVELQKTFGISAFTLAHYIEELLHTLYADAYLHARGRYTASQLATASYQAVEHQMDGHPWVIVNKSRLGFNYEDYIQYAPEADQQIQLSWIAVHKSRATFRSLDHIEEQTFFEQELGRKTLVSFQKTVAAHGVNAAAGSSLAME